MLPFLLAGLGGYLIGQSQKKDVPQMAKGGATGDVEVSVSLTKDESLLLYVVLNTKLKDEGRKIPKMKEAIQAKIIDAGESEQIELRLSVEQIMLIYLYMEEVQKKEPKLKPKMFKDITKKLFQAVERSNKALPKHFAQGGVLEHGLREGDRILVVNDSFAGIVDKDGNRIIVNIEEGTRRESTI